MRASSIFATLGLVTLFSGVAAAEGAGASASLTESGADASLDASGGYELGDDPFEIGIFAGGMMLEGRQNKPAFSRRVGAAEFDPFGLEVGLRLGAYPIAYLGIEAEGAAVATGSSDDANAVIGVGRGHLVGQLPLGFVAPFLVVGGVAIGGECHSVVFFW
jgi:hypothetical protein